MRVAGFSLGSHNNEGIFSQCNYFADNLEEHSGDIETDPWSWRIRGVRECDYLAYSKEYGWSVTTFCTVEKFFGEEVYEQSLAISKLDAVEKITAQIFVLNPSASAKDIKRFIGCK